MAGTFRYRVETGPEFRRVVRALREEGLELPENLRQEIRDTARPLVDVAQRKVLAIPVHGRKHSGLRARVARGVEARVIPVGVQIVTSMNDPAERHLPAYLDDPVKGWRHPVFGDDSRWVSQHTGAPWFRETFAEGLHEFKARLHHVLEDAAGEIGRAGAGR